MVVCIVTPQAIVAIALAEVGRSTRYRLGHPERIEPVTNGQRGREKGQWQQWNPSLICR
jgi:hypothetical protein